MTALLRLVVAMGTLLAGLAGAVTVAVPAHALSCVMPDDLIRDSDHVFAGRVVDSRDGRLLVEVDEVWTAGPVPERVWLRVGLPQWSGLADDGELPDGLSFEFRSLFAENGPIDSTGPCSMWNADDPMVVEHRPATVSAPVPGESGRPEASNQGSSDDEGGRDEVDGARQGEGGQDEQSDDTSPAGPVAVAVGLGTALSAAGGFWILRRRRGASLDA